MKKIKVLLLKDVNNLGKKGQIIDVSDGYARNYLFPKGLAQEVNEGMLEHLRLQEASQRKKEEKLLERFRKEKDNIEKETFVIKAKVGERGKLFGSITSKDIAEIISKKLKIEIDKRQINLEEPIKSLGEYSVEVKLHPQVVAKAKILVEAE
ncbi:50S ribosomal protein L9 [Dictyoglomus thermophilum]|uniref:Large ribosomal subunit protein bL9 n=1 Tax=Dictyoglomus thermophilum (strain ATCC 35947 / DSM 3960 / H-6-12) TaxID=309799 RepID=B5YEW5_DICT6|nr:50S ribosomal protein L9 [Dictyoglomus thermophilum]ACI19273.1 ribosomal protein L9 [Dictyoglomus thermophilum H-6-12]